MSERTLVLSYPALLRDYASALARGFEQIGLSVWCQADDRLPMSGAHPVDYVRQEIAASGGLLVLVGAGGLTRWQEAELLWAQAIQASNPHYLVLPLLSEDGARTSLPEAIREQVSLDVPADLDGLSQEDWALLVGQILDAKASLTEQLSGRIKVLVRPTARLGWAQEMLAQSDESLVIADKPVPTIESVPVSSDPHSPFLGAVSEKQLLLLTIHGGRVVPASYVPEHWKPRRDIERDYEIEKDWGANQLAWALAAKLGLGEFHRVNVARVLMDFGRFPGITDRHADHMHRFAISGIFSGLLGHSHKRALLKDHYDRISDYLEPRVSKSKLMLTIHTYDKLNYPARTRRPPVSLIHTPIGYHRDKTMPFGVFDPLYPDELAESTADRKLVARLALAFESMRDDDYRDFLGGAWDGWRFRVAFNHPYYLPDGSLEVRAQVWHFFDWLRTTYEEADPSSRDEPAFELVWKMLTDTNLRKADTVSLRSFLHMFRDPPEGELLLYDEEFSGAEPQRVAASKVMEAYKAVERFVGRDGHAVVQRYRQSNNRLSALTLELRKDLLWRFQEPPWEHEGRPIARTDPDAVRVANINYIAHVLAEGLVKYFRDDLGGEP